MEECKSLHLKYKISKIAGYRINDKKINIFSALFAVQTENIVTHTVLIIAQININRVNLCS